jgi:hypothetical protein
MTLTRSPMRRTPFRSPGQTQANQQLALETGPVEHQQKTGSTPSSTLPFPAKPRPCKACARSFIPFKPMQSVCGPACAHKLVKLEKVAEKTKDRERKESLKSLADLIREAQVEFNHFIRLRDAGLPCICCGKPMSPDQPGGSVDAGHFRSRGAAPQHRFNETNVFAQRKGCNRTGGATYGQFREGVIARIGLGGVELLEADNAPRKWTREELIEIKETYRAKWRALEKEMA